MTSFSAILILVSLFVGLSSAQANPPLDMVRSRAKPSATHSAYDVRVTQLGDRYIEYRGVIPKNSQTGTLRSGKQEQILGNEAAVAWRLLWIATLSAEPVAALEKWGTIDPKKASVRSRKEGFVYMYGDQPRFGVHRVSGKLLYIEVIVDGRTWRVEVEWESGVPVLVRVSSDAAPVLTAKFLAMKG